MPSQMALEIREIPLAAARLLSDEAQERFRETAAHLRALDPKTVLTIARGSSDHAAHCLKYAIEVYLGLPVASLGPSLATIHDGPLHLSGMVALSISQSGGSPDLCALTRKAGEAGATTIALTNVADSPLAREANKTLDIAAGSETAVAATKSYTNSILAGLWLVAHWSERDDLRDALHTLTDSLTESLTAGPLETLTRALTTADHIVCLGRGPSEGIARETALKATELLGIPALGISHAEALHGPSAMMHEGCPVVLLPSPDPEGREVAREKLAAQGAQVIDLSGPHAEPLPPLATLTRIYLSLEEACRARGRNPDAPAGLSKVTKTV